jgi:hypothetical protein
MELKEVMMGIKESNPMWRHGVIRRLVFHVCQIQKVQGEGIVVIKGCRQ